MENRSRVVNNRTNRTNKTNKAAEYQYGSAVRKLQAVPEVRTYEPKRRDEEIPHLGIYIGTGRSLNSSIIMDSVNDSTSEVAGEAEDNEDPNGLPWN